MAEPNTCADAAMNATAGEPHAMGTIWATALNDIWWKLVHKHGFSNDILDLKQPFGNIVMLRLIFGGFSLQPCNPTFLQARNAILVADKHLYGGIHQCDIWQGFARRGMGANAKEVAFLNQTMNDFNVPPACQKQK
jgi:extracellular elastinolytic metalloproteinase